MAISEREQRAVNFLQKYSLAAHKRPEQQTMTPDFLISSSDGFSFHLEVKAIEGAGDDNFQEWKPLYNSITSHIHKAVKQLSAVNPARTEPNVIILLAEDFRLHGRVLQDLFAGAISIESEVITDLKRYRDGRMRSDFSYIDLFILLDINENPFFCFNQDSRFLDKLVPLFNFSI